MVEITLTRKQIYLYGFILGVIVGLISLMFNFVYLYNKDEVSIYCDNGSVEVYTKAELNNITYYCGNSTNIYKYNKNEGLGVYFPKQTAIDYAYYRTNNSQKGLYITDFQLN